MSNAVLEPQAESSAAVRYQPYAGASQPPQEYALGMLRTLRVTPTEERLTEIAAEQRWAQLFSDSRSDRFLDDLMAEIVTEDDAGLTQDLDELL